ncbi:similar to An01g14640 [Aspergillus luchuensis]|uniref:Similar to An01g14640 n=1 Tax=Aspergillus kawachii TaxID=1069201 RepID=A0A146G0K6_ASPKA|nr:similar to An01g14640 [Aspergillus luchuensis]
MRRAIEYRAHFGQGEKCTDHGVVYGNRQMLDIDYDESFTPVASEIAPKMFMTNVAIKNHRWEHQNSVKGLYIRIREHHHTKVSLNDGDGSAIELDTGDLEWLMRGAPKMRAILPIIRDQVFLKQEKSLVWTYFPDEEVYVSAVLTETGIGHPVIHAGLSARERSIIVKWFIRDLDNDYLGFSQRRM